MEKKDYESVQFRVQRVFFPLELATVMMHSLGGEGYARFIGNLKLGRGYSPKISRWDKKSKKIQNEIAADSIVYLLCHEPALEMSILTPAIKPEIPPTDKLFDHLPEEQRPRVLEQITRQYVDALNRANNKIIREVSEMPLLYLDAHIDDILRSGDRELRWRTAWALAVDPKLTRVGRLSKLKYRTADEVLADYPFVFAPKSEGGMGHPLREDKLGMDENEVMLKLAIFRQFQKGIVKLDSEFGFFLESLVLDLQEEIVIYDRYANGLELLVENEKGKKNSAINKLEEAKSQVQKLQKEKAELSGQINASPAIQLQKPDKDYNKLQSDIAAARNRLSELAKNCVAEQKRANRAESELAEAEKTIINQERLIELLQVERQLREFYTNKKVAVVSSDGFGDNYSQQIEQFGATVELHRILEKPRQAESLASATSIDILFAPLSSLNHKVRGQLPQFKTIFYDPRSGSVPLALLRNIERLRKAGIE